MAEQDLLKRLGELEVALSEAEKEKSVVKDALIKANKRADDNEQYRLLFEDKVNRKVRDSVFLDLLSYPENQMKFYRALHPEDTEITPDDLSMFVIKHILTNHPYNDLGLLVRKKLLLLSEAETRWSENIIYRLAEYYYNSMYEHLYINKMNGYSMKVG